MPTSESLANPRLWLAFACMVFVSGITNAFPIFMPALLDEFGGSRAATAGAASIAWLGGAVLGPLAGRLVDRGDPRLVVTSGLAAAALGMLGASLAPTLLAFLLLLGCGAGIGVGLTGFVPQAAVITNTYETRRGFANGIAFSGSMLGFTLATPAHWAIRTFGWRWTLVGWAVIVLALIPPVLRFYPQRLLWRASPSKPSIVASTGGGATMWSVPFVALALVSGIAPIPGQLLTTQHALYLEHRGFPGAEVAVMFLIGGILSTSGRAIAGWASDRFGAAAAGFASYASSLIGTLSMVGLEFWPARVLAYGYVGFVFPPLGSRATIVSVLVTRLAPPGRYGAFFGMLIVGNSVGAALGPFLSGAIYDVTRSYLAIFIVAVALLVVSVVALTVFLRTAPRD